jgi:hypothetical protein
MMRKSEAQFVRHFILKGFDLRRNEFDNLSTICTDHVIVVIVFKMMLVIGLVVPKANFASKPRFRQKL